LSPTSLILFISVRSYNISRRFSTCVLWDDRSQVILFLCQFISPRSDCWGFSFRSSFCL
jgi:hypothetical protein